MPQQPGIAKLLIATTNPDKLREIRVALSGTAVELVTLESWPDIEAPEEIGTTFAENARAKALYYAARTNFPSVAEDSGLEIDALGGAPGVYSARFGGEAISYARRFDLLYEALAAVRTGGSPARFVCALALVEENTVVFEARGTIEGRIAPEPNGDGGFGYDPIFYYPPFGCTLAEAGDKKLSVSHRAEAFRQLASYLRERSR
jgi:XTP/dITP diphosphohydrolase